MHHNRHISYTDRELLQRFYNNKNNEWLGMLLERYFHLIFGVCMKYLKNEADAKDHTQQICMKVIRELPNHEVRYFKSWLYQVTKNHCLMHLRKNKPHTLPLEHTAEPAAEHAQQGKADALAKEQLYGLLENAVDSLKEEQKECVRQFYYEHKSYQEIADDGGYSLKQVKSFIQNGRRNIKVFIEKNENG